MKNKLIFLSLLAFSTLNAAINYKIEGEVNSFTNPLGRINVTGHFCKDLIEPKSAHENHLLFISGNVDYKKDSAESSFSVLPSYLYRFGSEETTYGIGAGLDLRVFGANKMLCNFVINLEASIDKLDFHSNIYLPLNNQIEVDSKKGIYVDRTDKGTTISEKVNTYKALPGADFSGYYTIEDGIKVYGLLFGYYDQNSKYGVEGGVELDILSNFTASIGGEYEISSQVAKLKVKIAAIASNEESGSSSKSHRFIRRNAHLVYQKSSKPGELISTMENQFPDIYTHKDVELYEQNQDKQSDDQSGIIYYDAEMNPKHLTKDSDLPLEQDGEFLAKVPEFYKGMCVSAKQSKQFYDKYQRAAQNFLSKHNADSISDDHTKKLKAFINRKPKKPCPKRYATDTYTVKGTGEKLVRYSTSGTGCNCSLYSLFGIDKSHPQSDKLSRGPIFDKLIEAVQKEDALGQRLKNMITDEIREQVFSAAFEEDMHSLRIISRLGYEDYVTSIREIHELVSSINAREVNLGKNLVLVQFTANNAIALSAALKKEDSKYIGALGKNTFNLPITHKLSNKTIDIKASFSAFAQLFTKHAELNLHEILDLSGQLALDKDDGLYKAKINKTNYTLPKKTTVATSEFDTKEFIQLFITDILGLISDPYTPAPSEYKGIFEKLLKAKEKNQNQYAVESKGVNYMFPHNLYIFDEDEIERKEIFEVIADIDSDKERIAEINNTFETETSSKAVVVGYLTNLYRNSCEYLNTAGGDGGTILALALLNNIHAKLYTIVPGNSAMLQISAQGGASLDDDGVAEALIINVPGHFEVLRRG